MKENNKTMMMYPLNNPNNPPREKSTNPDLFGWIIPIITLFIDDNNIYETIRVKKTFH